MLFTSVGYILNWNLQQEVVQGDSWIKWSIPLPGSSSDTKIKLNQKFLIWYLFWTSSKEFSYLLVGKTSQGRRFWWAGKWLWFFFFFLRFCPLLWGDIFLTTFYISVIILHMLHITNHAGLTGYDFTILFGLRYTKKKKLRTGKTGINNMVMQMRGNKRCPGRGKWVKIPLLPENVPRNPRNSWEGNDNLE